MNKAVLAKIDEVVSLYIKALRRKNYGEFFRQGAELRSLLRRLEAENESAR